MTLEQTKQLVKTCSDQMDACYKGTVFDEWAIVSLNDSTGRLLAYTGPRKEHFQKNFVNDAGPLRGGLLSPHHQTGDFEFARNNPGTAFEAFLVLGQGIFLICNNTQRTMDEIAVNPRWLSAQVPFVEFSDHVRENPVNL